MSPGGLRVVIVDRSPVRRRTIAGALEAGGDIAVVGEAASGAEAPAAIERLAPDLVTVDVETPDADGLGAIAWLMAHCPLPVLAFVGGPSGSAIAVEATRRGALHVLALPDAEDDAACEALREQVRVLAQVPVVRHLAPAALDAPPIATPAPAAARRPRLRFVAVGASAGGPSAVAKLIEGIPPEVPVVVVQHLPDGFVDAFARFLQGATGRVVDVARAPALPAPGVVHLAPDGVHLVATADGQVRPLEGAPIDGHRPSVTALFASAADALGDHVVGVLLSGMGADGATGLARLRAAGAVTFAQDAASSAVFGMPRAAIERGAAAHVLSPEAIGLEITRLLRTRGG